ncbi:VOC family protein [bacterium]|uniref:Glyoxalase/bleomycin resistance protein/dioxygenase n=1 Tax=Rubinisphaera brasiliensis (strain ATCC 49424 / DSM 5305 / JCM 21570 / IAM 15109 / NBRC 103401 / IFAM 1448) TaxID=756272 RepID=F0SJQ7_RUBBR|nr:VOC family protein [Rubinisphaera brasiliensis]ADY61895.1 Glyoxalase/bleomycin resistance protein/dioxygenase [Rubinisphaera brasiliensis DSM 5305]MBB02457.1 VOC family protein [Planctomyces sp.]MBR9803838.1 VOC family protein [bacterium]
MSIHELYAYICVADAAAAIEFYKQAFEAEEKFRLTDADGTVGHAEVTFGETILMIAEPFPNMGVVAPASEEAVSHTLHLHVDNADETIAQACAHGATLERAAEDHFYGERSGTIRDPFGHRWLIGHSIEEVSPEEMQRRYQQLTSG